MTLAEFMKDRRLRMRKTQEEIAQRAGLPIVTYRQYEQGKREPKWATLFGLADALRVPVEAFRDCVPKKKNKGK